MHEAYALVRLDHTADGWFITGPQGRPMQATATGRVRGHADQNAAGNDGNLRCESRMDRKSVWGGSHISERIASDEC